MDLTDQLERHRIAVGFVLLFGSWISIFLDGWAQLAVQALCIVIMLAGVVRRLSNYRENKAESGPTKFELIQWALALFTLLIIGWNRIKFGYYDELSPYITPLIALINLPRPTNFSPQHQAH